MSQLGPDGSAPLETGVTFIWLIPRRNWVAGGMVAAMACLFAAELLLGYRTGGHWVRSSLLGMTFVASIVVGARLHGEVPVTRKALAPRGKASAVSGTDVVWA